MKRERDRHHVYLYTLWNKVKKESVQIEACNIWQAAEKLGLGIDDVMYLHKVIL
jgi:hypothetical protein